MWPTVNLGQEEFCEREKGMVSNGMRGFTLSKYVNLTV